MQRQSARRAPPGVPLIVAGAAAAAALVALYARYQDPGLITPGAVDGVLRMAYAFYAGLLASLAAAAVGLRRLGAAAAAGRAGRRLGEVAALARGRRQSRVFAAVIVGYGALFSLSSGALVYQPELSFSEHYGVAVPSAELIPCCDAPGLMPKVMVYVTDSAGLQVVPAGLALHAAVAYLVALTAAAAAGAGALARGRRGVCGVGAAAGLLVACPACAGTLLSAAAGAAGGLAAAAALSQAQAPLIAATLPLLAASPFVLARMARRAGARGAAAPA